MAGKVMIVDDQLTPDRLGCAISEQYITWETQRQSKVTSWEEVQRYVFATDTSQTSNSQLPWSNKTTIPKLCQIRDNLHSNYMAAMFPKRKWLLWEGNNKTDDDIVKKQAIEAYMAWVIDRNEFYDEVSKLVLDYIDYGNAIATVDWIDNRVQLQDGNIQVGYVGPMLRRISPLDIVFNPVAPNFASAPKIVRSMVSIGEIKDMLFKMSMDEGEKEEAEALWKYLKEVRESVSSHQGSFRTKDALYTISGFDSFQAYLGSGYVEVLTFYGDIYDEDSQEFLKNHVIKVVDRHKILSKRPNPSVFGTAPIYHSGWRLRPDNLWAMGPLDNLVGMQYRVDHLENMKADIWDLTAFPVLKIKGYVEDFTWGPFEQIYVGDDGDVEMLTPNVQALAADTEINFLEAKMEEMAGSPKEAMGFRTPGEKTAYEVQRLENAASRIFESKIAQFERQGVENWLNAMLELARRHMDKTTIRAFDSEYKLQIFMDLTAEDLTGNGRIKPVAARHFAEQAVMLQNLNNFYASAAFQTVAPHFSSVEQARLWETLLNIEDYGIVQPYIAITEQTDAQSLMQNAQVRSGMEAQMPTNMTVDDVE
jgi:hypothetical protein